MNPFQHGEVFVTDDGAETDLDIGHYERFLDTDLGQKRQRHHRPGLLQRDRQGAPRRLPRRHRPGDPPHHQRDQGPRSAPWAATAGRRRRRRDHRDRRHRRRHRVAAVPRGRPPGAPRRRPRQLLLPARLAGALHRPVRRAEDQADPALRGRAALASASSPTPSCCRADREIPAAIKRRSRQMCDVDEDAVVTAADAPSIYDIPKVLHREGLDAYVVRRLDLPFRDVDWTTWDDLLPRVHHPKRGGHRRAGREVHRPARRLPLGRRGAARGRLRPRGRASRSGGSRPTSAPTRAAPRPQARRRRRDLRARRVRRPRHRGQARARSPTRAPTASRRSGCAWDCSAWSSSTPATSPVWRRPRPPSSTPTAPSR